MKGTPLVSVVLPVFNGEKFVAEAIHSIQSQTLTDWELVIVDDGSHDRSFEICRDMANQDGRIRVFRNERNLGLARTMNRLVSLARGKYIAIQEQDDVSVPERLAWEVEVLESDKEIGLVSGIAAWLNDEGQVFAYFPGLLVQGKQYPQDRPKMVKFLYTEQCKVVNAACMFRRSIANEISGPFDEKAKISIDWQFFLHVAHRYRIWGIPKVLVKMRRGEKHQSVTKNKDLQFHEARRCIRLIYDYYRTNPDSSINYWLYRKAMATEMILEGRYYSGIRGWLRLIQAIVYDPLSKHAWKSFLDLSLRGLNKGCRLLFPSRR